MENMKVSDCCGAERWLETDICSDCKEHADFVDEEENVMDSRLMELASDLATYLLEQRYGEDLYNEDDSECLTFKEPYQERFNRLYDDIEDVIAELNNYLNFCDKLEFRMKEDMEALDEIFNIRK